MGKGRLEAFSDGVIALNTWITDAVIVAVALMWLVPDRRIESTLQPDRVV